jgi:hypothetical protein
MANFDMYPKTMALVHMGHLSLGEQYGVLLLNSTYTFDAEHETYGDIPEDAIVGEATLETIQYEGANDRFMVANATAPSATMIADEAISAIVLYRQRKFEGDSVLFYYSEDITGLPITTSGDDILISFPDGILTMAPSGYSVPSIELEEQFGTSEFDQQVEEDIVNVILDPNGLNVSQVRYSHANNSTTLYYVLRTATPVEVPIAEVEASQVAQTIKMANSVLLHPPRRGDKVTLQGVRYIVAGAWAENYTTDVYLQVTL